MNRQNLPDELTQTGLFCCWRYEDRNGKQTKVPYHPLTGQRAKSNDPDSFVLYPQAVQATGFDGIGVGMFHGVCAIDLDDCITPEGDYTPTAVEIIERMHSYTELSPSGKGIHILFRAEGFSYDTKRYYIMNHPKGVEVYVAGATSKYVTVTGRGVNDYPFGERGNELKQVLERFMLRESSGNTFGRNGLNGVNPKNGVDAILDRAGSGKYGPAFRRLWAGDCTGYASQSEADLALCGHLAYWTGRDERQMDALFRRSGLMREKWDRPQSGSTLRGNHHPKGRRELSEGCRRQCGQARLRSHRPPEPSDEGAALFPGGGPARTGGPLRQGGGGPLPDQRGHGRGNRPWRAGSLPPGEI